MAEKTKTQKVYYPKMAEGGKNHMFSRQSSGTQKSGTAAQAGNKATKEKFAKGGKEKMFGKQSAGKKAPGSSGKVSSGK